MFQSYLSLAFRNLMRHKFFSLISLIGLAIGIAAFLLIGQYVSFELSYDDFHRQGKSIYRIRLDDYKNKALEGSGALGYYGAGPAIKEAFPEVINFVRLHRGDGTYSYLNTENQLISYYETEAFYADSSFFSVFSYPLLKGNPGSVLRKPNTMLLSERAARKYFGHQDPMGKIIQVAGWQSGAYTVEGVFADIPENSHLTFDFLFSIENLLKNEQFIHGAWYWTNFYSYMLVKPGTDYRQLEAKLPLILEKHLGKEFTKSGSQQKFVLQPLQDIYLHSHLTSEVKVNGNYSTLQILLMVSFFIIAIGWLNYINLSTAKAMERAREVGIRKVLGSSNGQLIKQFLFESLLLNALALAIAIGLLVLILPFLTQLIGKPLSFQFLNQLPFWLGFLSIFLMGTFLSGFYPAFFLSSFQPVKVLKGKLPAQAGGQSLRKGLLVFQFASCVLLLVATLTIDGQLNFMRQQDVGMQLEQQLVIRAPQTTQGESKSEALRYFKQQVKNIAAVKAATLLSEVPGKEIFWGAEWRRKQDPETRIRVFSILAVDQDFIPTYQIGLLAGRNFSGDIQQDYKGVILNEASLKALGFTSPNGAVGQEIVVNQASRTILGVIRDFHHESFRKAVKPLLLYYIPWTSGYLTLTLEGPQLNQTVEAIEAVYKQVFPQNAFEYFFLDDYFDQQYHGEERFRKLFTLFSGLSLLVACMGLLGLASYLAAARSREIGIRKALGASSKNILWLLNRAIFRPVLLANLLAWPLAYWGVQSWLQEYPYRLPLSAWLFIVPSMVIGLIAFLTLSAQTWKAARSSPVTLLREE